MSMKYVTSVVYIMVFSKQTFEADHNEYGILEQDEGEMGIQLKNRSR